MITFREIAVFFALCLVLFLQVIIPVGIVAYLLYVSRKISALVLYVFNLIFAVGVTLFILLCIINDMIGINWGAFSPDPPQPPRPLNLHDTISMMFLLCWVAGAIGLFFRKRLAWVGSVVGVGMVVLFLGVWLTKEVFAICLFPNTEVKNVRLFDGFATPGFILSTAVVLTAISILLAINLRLLSGLFHMRKELFAPCPPRLI
jgi:hypothetical protein